MRWVLWLSLTVNHGVNVILLGSPHQTVSARAGYARDKGSVGGRRICHVLGWLDVKDSKQEDHCTKAIRHEAERRAKIKT